MTNPRQRWAYLGPAGTFTEQAALDLAAREAAGGEAGSKADDGASAETDAGTGIVTGGPTGANRVDTTGGPELVAAPSVSAALAEVRGGGAAAAVVPLESSVEGAVPLTQDELTHGDPLLITAEAYVPVTFQLLVRSGTTPGQVRTIGSHPHGLAQVRDWVARELPQARTVVTDSTAAAAAAVADGTLDAAAAAAVAGVRYGLAPLADDIGLVHDAITRFVLLRRPVAPPAPTGNDRTSMVLWVANEPGTLLGLLTEFSVRGINLTRLESRPTRTRPGEYVFLVDADGHVTDPAMADVLAALLRRGALLRYLGSYPRLRGRSVPPPRLAAVTYADAGRIVADFAAGRVRGDGDRAEAGSGVASRGGWGTP